MGEYAIDQMIDDVKRETGVRLTREYFEDDDRPRKQRPKCLKCGRLFRVPQAVADHMRDKHATPAVGAA